MIFKEKKLMEDEKLNKACQRETLNKIKVEKEQVEKILNSIMLN